jgi:hypothetical protein
MLTVLKHPPWLQSKRYGFREGEIYTVLTATSQQLIARQDKKGGGGSASPLLVFLLLTTSKKPGKPHSVISENAKYLM